MIDEARVRANVNAAKAAGWKIVSNFYVDKRECCVLYAVLLARPEITKRLEEDHMPAKERLCLHDALKLAAEDIGLGGFDASAFMLGFDAKGYALELGAESYEFGWQMRREFITGPKVAA